MVPKSLYISTSEEDVDKDRSPDGPDSIYHTAYVVKDFPHEVTTADVLYCIVMYWLDSRCGFTWGFKETEVCGTCFPDILGTLGNSNIDVAIYKSLFNTQCERKIICSRAVLGTSSSVNLLFLYDLFGFGKLGEINMG